MAELARSSACVQLGHGHPEFQLASRAFETGSLEPVLEHRLDPFVEARLADVVQRLRAAWLAGPALLWGDIYPIREAAVAKIDKRVATTLARGFFQFSQFLAGFEVLALELKKSGIVREQSLLSLEKLLHESGCFFVDESLVAGGGEAFGDVSRCGD